MTDQTKFDPDEPTGVEAIKKGGQEVYRYLFEKGAGRFVNTNKACRGCPQMKNCYAGKHALVGHCDENPDPVGR